jgi:site-specific DNA recombinase
MLRNAAYTGTMYFNRHESLDGDPPTAGRRRRSKSRTRYRPSTEWIPITIPPIISEELFRRSQAIHFDNSRFSPRHLQSGHYLLRGLIRCRVCDLGASCHRMRGRDGTFHHYYYCAGHDALRASRPIGRCSQRHLRADELDELVWAEVRRHLDSPALIMEGYTKLRAQPARRPDDLVAHEARAFQKKLAELDREEHRLLDAYQAGLIELQQLERRHGLLRQRREHLQAGLETVRGERTAALQRAELQMSLESFARSLRGTLGTLSFEHRQRLVRTVIERVLVGEAQVDIHLAIPVPEPPKGDGPDGQGHVSTDFRLRPHRQHSGQLVPAQGEAQGRPRPPRRGHGVNPRVGKFQLP